MHTFSMENTVTVTHTLIFDLMSSRNMYLYNAYIYTYILIVFVLEIQADTHYTVIGCEN